MESAPAPQKAATSEGALFRLVPRLRGRVPWHPIGAWPTRIDEVRWREGGEPIYLKREDLSSSIYGGNKVRTLEGHFGAALAGGAAEIWSSGAFGSNHATAASLHARGAGLIPGAALFRQPPSVPAQDNMRAYLSVQPLLQDIANVVLLPAALVMLRRRRSAYVMEPGGASPVGCLGHVGAALELAEQVARHECPAPRVVVLAVGSTCTTAGLLAGFQLAARLGIAFGPGRAPLPLIRAVRATPWPITSPMRIISLARRTAAWLEELGGSEVSLDRHRIGENLEVDGRFLGRGYGRAAASTRGAMALMRGLGGPALDEVYSGKSGAALFQQVLASRRLGPHLFWATKSSAPLPRASAADIRRAPARWRAWLALPPHP